MIKRYTPTVLDGAAHMEIMGAGEWVRWEDYVSHIEAANQLAKQAQLDAENWAHRAALADDATETARAEGRADPQVKALVDAAIQLNTACDTMWNDSDRVEPRKSVLAGKPFCIREYHCKAIAGAQQALFATLANLKEPKPCK